MKEKKGISLIVLIVTIIVMIIIAGAIIISLSDTNIIDQADKATKNWNISTIKEQLNIENVYRTSGIEEKYLSKLNNGSLIELGIKDNELNDTLVIENGSIAYRPEKATPEKVEEFQEQGILPATYIGIVASEESKLNYANSTNLITIDQLANYTDKTVHLLEDITVTDWTTINEFTGTFVGNNHTISGLNSTLVTSNKGIIKGLILDGIIETTGEYGVGFAIHNYGIIENCTNKADVSGNDSAGIVGINELGAKIVNCCNEGDITANAWAAAGIAVYSDGMIYASYNKGTIKGYNALGIVFGPHTNIQKNIQKHCYNKGTIIGELENAGIIHTGNKNSSHMYNIGDVNNTISHGGVALSAMGITNCYSLGKAVLYGLYVDGGINIGNDNIKWIEDLGATENEQKAELLKRLNVGNKTSIWVEDVNNINDGFPILYWQVQ